MYKRQVIALWSLTLEYAWRDGNLEGLGEDGIAEACEWDENPGKLIQALRECGKQKNGETGPGFLDGFVVHNWTKRAGRLIWQRLRRLKAKDIDKSQPSPSSAPDPNEYHRRAKEILARRARAG